MKIHHLIPFLTVMTLLTGCADQLSGTSDIPEETAAAQIIADTPEETGNGQDEEIAIESKDHTIYGTYTAPQGEYDSAVLLLHGYGADREVAGMFTEFAGILKEQCHMASFRFDMKAVRQIAEEGFTQYTLAEGSRDTAASLRWLKETHPGLKHIFILGHSMGGTIAIMNEAENAGMYDGVIGWAAAADLTVLYTPAQLEQARADGFYRMDLSWKDSPIWLPLEWFEEMENLDLPAISAQGKAPLLAINGKRDDTVGFETGETLTQVRCDKKSAAIVYEEADHMFRNTRDALYRDTADFLNDLRNH